MHIDSTIFLFQENVSNNEEEMQLSMVELPENTQTETVVPETFSKRNSPPQLPLLCKRKKIISEEDPRIEEAFRILKKSTAAETQNPYSAYGQHIAQKMMGYSSRTRILVEHAINNVLFEADMGRQDRLCTMTSAPATFNYSTPVMPSPSFSDTPTPIPSPSHSDFQPSTSSSSSYFHNPSNPNSNVPSQPQCENVVQYFEHFS